MKRLYMFKLFMESMGSLLIKTEFKHVWFTDQLTSMVGPLRDMEYTLCYYVHYTGKIKNIIYLETFDSKKQICHPNRVIVMLLGVFPHLIRTLQVNFSYIKVFQSDI